MAVGERCSTIPAWVLAQLIDAAGRLDRAVHESPNSASSQPTLQPKLLTVNCEQMRINAVLAQPHIYIGKLMSLRGRIVRVEDITSTLSLPAGDRCLSVIAIDDDYCAPVQVITVGDVNRFAKNAKCQTIGWLITTRVDAAEPANNGSTKTNGSESSARNAGDSSIGRETVTVPVLVGAVVCEASATTSQDLTMTSQQAAALAGIVMLTVVYIAIRIRIGRSGPRWIDRLATKAEGHSDADGTR